MEELGMMEKVITTYGPLGLGWFAYWYERRINASLQDSLTKLLAEDAAAKVGMREALNQLTLFVQTAMKT